MSARSSRSKRSVAYEANAFNELVANMEDDGRLRPDGPVRPLYWHPFYREKTFLLDWLNSPSRESRLVPVIPPLRYPDFKKREEEYPPKPIRREYLTLTKQVALGRAPYVGEPFAYRWYVATDNLGRSIASEAAIVYLSRDD